MKNQLKNQRSPYLLQHAENPVAWYSWCQEAFDKARKENKPIFLSIGYSTCHWCHVMAHESFEDQVVADILNEHFISIKVDKEERPDIDSVYMAVCQTMTGSGGWPLSIFMTPEQKPFFSGTYFPKESRHGIIGFVDLLKNVGQKWKTDRESLLASTDKVMEALRLIPKGAQRVDEGIIKEAIRLYKNTFDSENGGFGGAPKFPVPHNLLFLLECFEKNGDKGALQMAETTLMQMYRGGIFDHIGFGFSRYSTDPYFLVPHFEKMLYDNGLLMEAYCTAFTVTQKEIYREIAEKIATYLLREMQEPKGGFYCAQDADSDGVEGRYYVLKPEEIKGLLGEKKGEDFNLHYDITDSGNFEGWNIPNLLRSKEDEKDFDHYRAKIYEYRLNRHGLHLDDKVLTSWNSLVMSAFANLYRVSGNLMYLEVAQGVDSFIRQNLIEDHVLYSSFVKGQRGNRGLLDDYAFYIRGLIALYEATGKKSYLDRAQTYCCRATDLFCDEADGGFFLYGEKNEQLIIRPKEFYDGAIPSGNSVMAYNLVRIHLLTGNLKYESAAENQLAFMCGSVTHYPTGYSYFLRALLMHVEPVEKIVVVLGEGETIQEVLKHISLTAIATVLETPTSSYPLLNNKTTYYVCKGHTCLPPTN